MEGLAEQGGVTFTDSDMLKTTRSVFFSERRNFRAVIVPNFGYIYTVPSFFAASEKDGQKS